MKTESQVRKIRQFLFDFGPGYHPDTDIHEYHPKLNFEQTKDLLFVNLVFNLYFTEKQMYDIVLPIQEFLLGGTK
jgi:hypothetical protein